MSSSLSLFLPAHLQFWLSMLTPRASSTATACSMLARTKLCSGTLPSCHACTTISLYVRLVGLWAQAMRLAIHTSSRCSLSAPRSISSGTM